MVKRFCASCKKSLESRYQTKFCSIRCQFDYQHQVYISAWKKGLRSGTIGISTRAISSYIKTYLFDKFQNGCSICGWNKIHSVTKKIPLEIDHIDGNSENNVESNLRLICPNCHSLSENYKALNKGKGRKWRMDKYVKNK